MNTHTQNFMPGNQNFAGQVNLNSNPGFKVNPNTNAGPANTQNNNNTQPQPWMAQNPNPNNTNPHRKPNNFYFVETNSSQDPSYPTNQNQNQNFTQNQNQNQMQDQNRSNKWQHQKSQKPRSNFNPHGNNVNLNKFVQENSPNKTHPTNNTHEGLFYVNQSNKRPNQNAQNQKNKFFEQNLLGERETPTDQGVFRGDGGGGNGFFHQVRPQENCGSTFGGLGNFHGQKENSFADMDRVNRLTNSSKTADDGMGLGLGKGGGFMGSLHPGQGQS